MSAKSVMAVVLGLFPMYSHAATRFVATTGVNSGACTSQASPCRTIPYGASQMVAGDTLIVARTPLLQATPPATISRVAPLSSRAARVLDTSTSHTAC